MKSLIAIVLMFLVMTGNVGAQPTGEAETLASQAKEQFKAGEFDVSAKLFMAAYAKSHSSALIYNAARAYEESGKKGDAITLFRMYISLSKDEAGIADAKQRIAKLEAPTSPIVVPHAPPPVVTQPPKVVPTPKPLTSTKIPVAQGPNRTSAWLTTGGSVVLVGAGLGLLADGASGTQRYSGSNRASYDASRTEWWAGLGMVGVGAALGGVSVYLWTRQAPVTVVPTTKGVVVGGKF